MFFFCFVLEVEVPFRSDDYEEIFEADIDDDADDTTGSLVI